jgi:exonuclease III
LNKTDFQPKVIKTGKEGLFILIKEKIYQDEISILNIYAPDTRVPTFLKETLLKFKADITPHTIIVGDFTTPFSSMGRSWKQKLNSHSETSRSFEQLDLTDICRSFHPKTKEYNFFSASHSTFSKTGHIIGYKTGLSRHKTIEIIPCFLSHHHRLRLVCNNNNKESPPTHGS